MTIGQWQYTNASRLSVSRTNADGTYEGTLTSNPEVQAWIALGNAPLDPVEPPASVPHAVTMRQARLALLQAGKLAEVNAAITGMAGDAGEAARIEWEYSQEVQRHKALVLALAPVLGFDDAQLDALFVLAATL